MENQIIDYINKNDINEIKIKEKLIYYPSSKQTVFNKFYLFIK